MTLFCSDIDGTLLNPERTLSARTIAALRAVQDAGHLFVLCSSRMPASMEILERMYGARDVPLIAYNGGLVLRSDRSVSLDIRVAPADARSIYEQCERLGLHGSFYSGDDWYAWAADFWADRETNNTGVKPNAETARDYMTSGRVDAAPPHKVMCMGDPAAIDLLALALSRTTGLVSYRSKDSYLEIANAACSKGDALRTIAADLHVDLTDAFFFGDNYNDLPAFAAVGTSVAVSNAKDSVIERASVVTARHHDDGVAIFLEAWLCNAEKAEKAGPG